MGIEEMINEYKKQIENNMKYIKREWACEADRISGMKIAVDVLRKVVKDMQLLKSSLPTQQDKVVVPGEIFEWFVETLDGKERFDGNDVFRIIQDVLKVAEGYETWNDYNIDEKIVEYAEKNEENFLKLLVNCSKDNGYTVEKEQLYYVQLLKDADNELKEVCLSYREDTQQFFLDQKAKNQYPFKTQFTEKEIRAIDQRYWAFAVPVEEDE